MERPDLNALDLTKIDPVQAQAAANPGSAIVIGAAAVKIFDFNYRRSFATIVNHGAGIVFLGFFPNVTATTGIALVGADLGTMTFGLRTDMPWTGEVWAISAAGTTLLLTEVNEPFKIAEQVP